VDVIRKSCGAGPAPNLRDYDSVRASFSWAEARHALDGLPDHRGLNIAHEAVDRHAAGPRAGRVALRFLRLDGGTEDVSYSALPAPGPGARPARRRRVDVGGTAMSDLDRELDRFRETSRFSNAAGSCACRCDGSRGGGHRLTDYLAARAEP
jgi:hypothetical protein